MQMQVNYDISQTIGLIELILIRIIIHGEQCDLDLSKSKVIVYFNSMLTDLYHVRIFIKYMTLLILT